MLEVFMSKLRSYVAINRSYGHTNQNDVRIVIAKNKKREKLFTFKKNRIKTKEPSKI